MFARVACLFAVSLIGCSEPETAPTGKSDVAQSDVDLGEITLSPEGRQFAVEVRNVGSAPLKITKVTLSCGCTTTEDFDARIPAGEFRSIPLRVRPTNAGPGSSRVRVSTDENPSRTHSFRIQWTASADLEPDPVRIAFGNVKPGTRHERVVKLRIRSPQVGVTDWECVPAHRLTAHPVEHGVTVQLEAGDEIGSFTGSLTGTAAGGWPATIRVPIEWSVRQSVEALPSRLFLGNVQPGEVITRSLRVASPLGEPFEVTAVEIDGIEGLDTQLGLRQGNGHEVKVTWTPPATPGPHSGTIKVAVSAPDCMMMTIPVSGYVAETNGSVAQRGQK